MLKIMDDNKGEKVHIGVNEEEYKRIYAENLQRIKSLFSQGYSLLTVICAIWTLTVSVCLSLAEKQVIDLGNGSTSFYIIALMFLLGLPIFISFPLSVRQHDNLRAICSLSAYTKVFFEMPSIVRKEKCLFAWETAHCDSKLSKTTFFNFEYILIVIVSNLFTLICGFLSIVNSIFSKNITLMIVTFVAVTLFQFLLIFLSVSICKNAKTKHHIDDYSKKYLNIYLELASELGFATEEEIKGYERFLLVCVNK